MGSAGAPRTMFRAGARGFAPLVPFGLLMTNHLSPIVRRINSSSIENGAFVGQVSPGSKTGKPKPAITVMEENQRGPRSR